MAVLEINGISVGYDGDGPALLLVHGHPFDRSMWLPQIRHFSRAGCRVIAPDLRGYGSTTVVPGRTELSVFAGDLAALLDALGLRDVVLAGLSMGGQIVMEFHRLFPDRVRALILADTTAAAETPAGRRLRNEVADRVVREGMTEYAEELLPRMLAAQTLATLPSVAADLLAMMRAAPAEGAAAALRGSAERPDYFDTLSRVTVPTTIVVGSDDAYTPIDDARAMHEHVPGSTLVIVDGTGHLPNLERPDEFNRAVTQFLDTLPRRP